MQETDTEQEKEEAAEAEEVNVWNDCSDNDLDGIDEENDEKRDLCSCCLFKEGKVVDYSECTKHTD